jgi:hypothetical protein
MSFYESQPFQLEHLLHMLPLTSLQEQKPAALVSLPVPSSKQQLPTQVAPA